MTGGIRYSIKGSGSQPTSRFNLFAGRTGIEAEEE
jgi:hypothetical protein